MDGTLPPLLAICYPLSEIDLWPHSVKECTKCKTTNSLWVCRREIQSVGRKEVKACFQVFFFICIGWYICVWMCVHMCGNPNLILKVFLDNSPLIHFEAGSPTFSFWGKVSPSNLELANMAALTSQLGPEILSLSPECGNGEGATRPSKYSCSRHQTPIFLLAQHKLLALSSHQSLLLGSFDKSWDLWVESP